MSLLTLLKPHGAAVVTPPAPTENLPPTNRTARHQRIPPPQLVRFPAAKARIYFNALAPQLILLPEFGRASISLHGKRPALHAEIEIVPKKHHLTYRAIRDEPEVDDEFRRLVEAAYLLTR